MLIVGLTGGIASGKSTVARLFAERGIDVVDVDDIAREIVEPGEPALEAIRQQFGADMLDSAGRLDRARLRQHIFTDEEQRRQLEAITHPRIRERLLERLERFRSGGADYALLVSPLLLETSQSRLVDRILVVDVPQALQIERACQRDDVEAEHIQAIITAQMPSERRRALADDIIDNRGNVAELASRVRELHEHYRQLARQRS